MKAEGEQQTSVFKKAHTQSETGQKLIFMNVGKMSPRLIELLTDWVNVPGAGELKLVKKFVSKEQTK